MKILKTNKTPDKGSNLNQITCFRLFGLLPLPLKIFSEVVAKHQENSFTRNPKDERVYSRKKQFGYFCICDWSRWNIYLNSTRMGTCVSINSIQSINMLSKQAFVINVDKKYIEMKFLPHQITENFNFVLWLIKNLIIGILIRNWKVQKKGVKSILILSVEKFLTFVN